MPVKNLEMFFQTNQGQIELAPLQFQDLKSPNMTAPADMSVKVQRRQAMRCDELAALAPYAPVTAEYHLYIFR